MILPRKLTLIKFLWSLGFRRRIERGGQFISGGRPTPPSGSGLLDATMCEFFMRP